MPDADENTHYEYIQKPTEAVNNNDQRKTKSGLNTKYQDLKTMNLLKL